MEGAIILHAPSASDSSVSVHSTEDEVIHKSSNPKEIVEEPKVGMVLASLEDLFEYYKQYSKQAGFGIRKRSLENATDGETRYVVLGCEKGGKRKNTSTIPLKPILSKKTDCKARLRGTVHKEGYVTLTVVELKHNHDLSTPSKVRLFRSNKKLDAHVKRRLEINDQAGISVAKNFNPFVVEGGGYEQLTFGEKECHSHIEKARRLKLGVGDAATIQKYFVRMQEIPRMGFGCQNAASTMIVVITPSPELALTNYSYCSFADFNSFSIPGSSKLFALVGDAVVLTLRAHDSVMDGHIALNAIHCRQTKVSPGDSVSVSRFVQPDDFNLALLTLELEFIMGKSYRTEELDASVLAQQLQKRFIDQVMTVGQKVSFEFCGTNYIFTVNQALIEGQQYSKTLERGIISKETYFVFEASPNSGIKIFNQRESASSNIFKQKEFNLLKLGVGGLSAQFVDIFRRAFASRVYPPHITNKLGIKHVKGILLYGPPGTGKTLLARQIGKFLNGKEPKIVNGPEILSKFVGETEKNVRELFADAENDQRTRGDQSDLHVIIFDEIDAICKSRGSTRDGTGVHDSIVNQLLTKIDGVESLNNVLLIGMTNRKDLLDEALLRHGRLEVHIEINLPDENGRLQILQIHTNKMQENSFLAADVNLQELAAWTKNFSGAELEGVVKSAVSFALNRQITLNDLTKPLDEQSIKVTMDDFLHALGEVIPAFGTSTHDLVRCR